MIATHYENAFRASFSFFRQWKQHRSRIKEGASEVRPRASSPSSSASTSAAGEPQQPGSIGASSGASEERRENFISRVMKPLQDFGFGKMSFMEGGVGLFVFAGVGAVLPGY